MKGNCKHLTQTVMLHEDGERFGDFAPAVQLFNDDDGFYHTIFETAAEVEEFIAQLRKVSSEAFGGQPPR